MGHTHTHAHTCLQGVELSLSALRLHWSSRKVVTSGLRMVWKLATASPDLRNRVRALGGLSTVAHVLARVPTGTVR